MEGLLADRGNCGTYGGKACHGEESGDERGAGGFFPEEPALFLHIDGGAAGAASIFAVPVRAGGAGGVHRYYCHLCGGHVLFRVRGGEADGEQAVFLGAFDGGRLFPGVGGGFAGGGEGGCAGGEIVFYDAGVVCRRGDAWGDVELK